MRWFAAIFILCLLAGCATTAGRGSRLLPWNWFAPDHATQLQHQQETTQEIEDEVAKRVQIEVEKVVLALKAARQDDRGVQVAQRAAENAQQLLTRANGQVSAEDLAKLKETVQNLLSENADLRARGERQQAAAEAINLTLSGSLDESRTRESTLTEKLQESDKRYQAEAEKSRRLLFWVCIGIGSWLLLQLLSGASRFFPTLAPVARVAGLVSAPVVQAAYEKLAAGVSRTIRTGEQLAATGATIGLRQTLDNNTDEAEQAAIRAHYEKLTRAAT